MSTPVKIVLGTGGIGSSDDPLVGHNTPESAQAFLNIFRQHGHTEIDTARAYSPHAPGTCEPLLGQTDITSWAVLDTKIHSMPPYDYTPTGIAKGLHDSFAALNLSSVNIYYLHFPDRTSSFSSTHQALDAAHRAGKFTHLGLSNFESHEVETFMRQSADHGWVKPTYFQGQYNAVCRSAETAILPTLRKHNIAFYAYSPGAGGFFGKQFRHSIDSMFGAKAKKEYGNEGMGKALGKIEELSEKEGVSPHAIALRWVVHHSQLKGEKGDGIVIGARTDEQLEGTLKACEEGKLSDEMVMWMDEVWKELEPDAPYFSPFKDFMGKFT